ncbi:hypothetical protein A5643_05860 [Mycobacterium sp. 1274756.6]|nr:hypothetical protein A5643_05860 [Mycobacterium sp. 1274756.6]
MSMAEILLYFVAIPGGLATVLGLWAWTGKRIHPATYRMSEPWTHAPILWAAVDEAVGPRHGEAVEFSVGGGASGKW